MKTKPFLFSLMFFVTMLFISSCDEIEAPYEKNSSPDNPQTDSNLTRILIEEFTGFRCINCPRGARLAHTLAEYYPGRVVIVSIHAGGFASPDEAPYLYDFRTSIGKELNSYFKINSYPCGMINRVPFNSNKVMSADFWSQAIQDLFNTYKSAPVIIKLTPEFNSNTSEITLKANLEYLQPASNTQRLSVWITEDNIKYWQKDEKANPPDVENYIHNGVLRYSFNGTWGDLVSSIELPIGSKINKEFSYTLPVNCDWNPENLKIVAFVYDEQDNGRILQVVEQKLINKN